MAALVYWLSCLALVLAVAAAYTFKNCIETRDGARNLGYKCIQRKETNISAIMDDLQGHVINLSIWGNSIPHIPDKAFTRFTDLQLLRLDSNNVSTIDALAFSDLHQLRSLNLSFNNISQLSPSLFASLHNLTFLLLRGNRLKRLPVGIFFAVHKLGTLILQQNLLTNFSEIVESVSRLGNLSILKLCHNKFTSLEHNRIAFPRSLTKLYLYENKLSTLGCQRSFLSGVEILDLSYNSRLTAEDFAGVDLERTNYLKLDTTAVDVIKLLNISNIQAGHVDFTGTGVKNSSLLLELCEVLRRKMKYLNDLRLGNNSIWDLANDTLSHCPTIRMSLDLSRNQITSRSLEESSSTCLRFLGKNRSLKTIIMENNKLTRLYSCRNVRPFHKLEELNLRYNRILIVSPYAFHHTPNVVTLNLNINTIAFLAHKALKGLVRLRTLRLDNNLLTDLFIDTFEDLTSLQTLNLRNNRISVIFNKTFYRLNNLATLDLGGNKISQIHPAGLEGLRNLSNLYLDGNHLNQIDMCLHPVFEGMLKVLDLENNFIHFSRLTVISPFVNLSRLEDLKLGNQRPYGLKLLPRKFFHGLGNLTSLYLTNNQISYIAVDAFDELKRLRFLTLNKCCDVNIPLLPGMFKNLRNLSRLTLENAGIQNFSREVFGNLSQVQTLQLNHNGMQSLDVGMLSDLHRLRYLDIRNLPLSCTCLNSQLQNWTVSNRKVQVVYVYNLPCQEGQKNFYNFETNVCYIDLGEFLFFSTAVAVTLLTVIPLLYVKLYWKMKYGYYVFRSWFGEQWRKFKEEEENCMYDAFVSYNSNDEVWVMEQLLPKLEGTGSSLKLCLHHRDFEPGRDIVDNIVAAVYSSRKTICVVSRNFIQSEWCSLEIQLASYRLFDEHRDVLLLVFLEPVSEHQMSSYHRMRKVMLKKTYLQWPSSDCVNPVQAQELFWNQLRRAVKAGSKLEMEDRDETRAAPEDLGDSDTQTLIADGNYYTY
ncbi:toll-like receptor 21 [Syngnathus typhle]|uniref:toll-like receptor 21 n=1 Tax=Syngnathus typhle TaxID=161592 RepID=UPI002A6A9C37|nr:toll-like receptor 21 [Syngnathus typhle]XP_061146127.1 toll-like receptor 21 [Syngnathus typhle]